MTRIQNGNFNLVEERRPKFNLVKFFAPSVAVVAVIVLFFTLLPQSDKIQQQVQSQNTVGDSQAVINGIEKNNTTNIAAHKSDNVASERSLNNVASNPQHNRFAVPITSSRSVSVDDYISGAKSNANQIVGGATVNSGDQPLTNGFLVEKKTDKETLEKYRDSLKRAQQIADSLKKARN
jgi:uncharacterized membrane protein YfhO